jgi:hypothetical protein
MKKEQIKMRQFLNAIFLTIEKGLRADKKLLQKYTQSLHDLKPAEDEAQTEIRCVEQ